MRDGTADGVAGNIVVGSEQAHDSVDILRAEGDNDVNVAGHAWLRVVVHRHRTREHVSETAAFQPQRNVADDVEFVLHVPTATNAELRLRTSLAALPSRFVHGGWQRESMAAWRE